MTTCFSSLGERQIGQGAQCVSAFIRRKVEAHTAQNWCSQGWSLTASMSASRHTGQVTLDPRRRTSTWSARSTFEAILTSSGGVEARLEARLDGV